MTLPLNPYVAGNPVGDSPAFVGWADVLRDVLRILRRPQDNALVLYGQRRIGKTSILEHLANWLPREGAYNPVYFDLQDKATWTLGHVVESLARAMADSLGHPPPDLGSDPTTSFRETWLPDLLGDLAEGSSLVLLFDEFDVLAVPRSEQARSAFFPHLRALLRTAPTKLQFVFVIGRSVDAVLEDVLDARKNAFEWLWRCYLPYTWADAKGRRRTKHRLYLYLKDLDIVKDLAESYYEKRILFRDLKAAHFADLLRELRLTVTREGRKVTFSQMSEGEQQLLTVLGLLRFTQEEEALFLLDEPDTHLRRREWPANTSAKSWPTATPPARCGNPSKLPRTVGRSNGSSTRPEPGILDG